MVPFGDEDRRYLLGEFSVVNDGTGSQEFGNYLVKETSAETDYIVKIRRHRRRSGWKTLIARVMMRISQIQMER